MITLPPDIDRDMLPRSDADAADERCIRDAVLAEVERPGRFAVVPEVHAITFATDDTGLAFRGNAKQTVVPVGEEDDPAALRSIGEALAGLVAMDGEVELMLRLVGPESTAERIADSRLRVRTPEARHGAPAHAVAAMNEQLAAELLERFGTDNLGHVLDSGAVVTGATELSGQPLWGRRILLSRYLPVSKRYRWNGVIEGATVDRGWWTTVRRRASGGGKVVTVGVYETPLLGIVAACQIVHVKGAGA